MIMEWISSKTAMFCEKTMSTDLVHPKRKEGSKLTKVGNLKPFLFWRLTTLRILELVVDAYNLLEITQDSLPECSSFVCHLLRRPSKSTILDQDKH